MRGLIIKTPANSLASQEMLHQRSLSYQISSSYAFSKFGNNPPKKSKFGCSTSPAPCIEETSMSMFMYKSMSIRKESPRSPDP